MALVVADRVLETCTAPGTGAVTLLGAVTGFQTFNAGIGNTNSTYYTIADQSGPHLIPAAHGAGVHPERAADGAGDAFEEFETGQAGLRSDPAEFLELGATADARADHRLAGTQRRSAVE